MNLKLNEQNSISNENKLRSLLQSNPIKNTRIIQMIIKIIIVIFISIQKK